MEPLVLGLCVVSRFPPPTVCWTTQVAFARVTPMPGKGSWSPRRCSQSVSGSRSQSAHTARSPAFLPRESVAGFMGQRASSAYMTATTSGRREDPAAPARACCVQTECARRGAPGCSAETAIPELPAYPSSEHLRYRLPEGMNRCGRTVPVVHVGIVGCPATQYSAWRPVQTGSLFQSEVVNCGLIRPNLVSDLHLENDGHKVRFPYFRWRRYGHHNAGIIVDPTGRHVSLGDVAQGRSLGVALGAYFTPQVLQKAILES